MFAFVLAVLVLLLVVVTVLRSPWILLLAALVFVYFYVIVPSQDPTAPRFGELDPTQASPTGVRRSDGKEHAPAERAASVQIHGERAFWPLQRSF